MTRIKLQFVNVFRDRHGKLRYYFRRPGRKSVALRGPPGSERFMEAYAAALAGDAPRLDIGASRSKPGTVAALVAAYFASIAFNDLAKNTQQVRRNILERFRAEHGGKRVVMLQQQHIANMVAAKAATPSAARSFLNTMRALMQFAIEVHFRTDDPTQGVRRPRIKSDGFTHGRSRTLRGSRPYTLSDPVRGWRWRCFYIRRRGGLMWWEWDRSIFAVGCFCSPAKNGRIALNPRAHPAPNHY